MKASDKQLIDSVFAGDDETSAHLRALDWSATPLGPLEQWPQALRTIVRVVLDSGYPMAISWGLDYVLLYNDAYRPIAGTRHPWALGRGAREVYPEAWNVIGPMYESVIARGKAVNVLSDVLVPLTRNNYLEEVYMAYSASPIPDDSGRVGGVLNSALETTVRVIEDRRRQLLRDLASRAAEARSDQGRWSGRRLRPAIASRACCRRGRGGSGGNIGPRRGSQRRLRRRRARFGRRRRAGGATLWWP